MPRVDLVPYTSFLLWNYSRIIFGESSSFPDWMETTPSSDTNSFSILRCVWVVRGDLNSTFLLHLLGIRCRTFEERMALQKKRSGSGACGRYERVRTSLVLKCRAN